MEQPRTKRQLRAEQTKALIVAAALRLFRERGFEAVTVEDITTTAGVARGSFYTYFKSRSEIIVAQFSQIDEYYRRWSRNLVRYPTASQKLLAFTRAQMRYVRDTVGVADLKVLYSAQALDPGSDKMLLSKQRGWQTIIAEVIALGQDSGEFRADRSAAELAGWFNRAMRGLFLDWCVSSAEHFDLVREGCDYCEHCVLPALRASPVQMNGGST